jgi:hypothetical protein
MRRVGPGFDCVIGPWHPARFGDVNRPGDSEPGFFGADWNRVLLEFPRCFGGAAGQNRGDMRGKNGQNPLKMRRRVDYTVAGKFDSHGNRYVCRVLPVCQDPTFRAGTSASFLSRPESKTRAILAPSVGDIPWAASFTSGI